MYKHKALAKKKDQVLFELHQKWWPAARKKTTFFVQLKQIFGPSYFVRGLVV